jgi:hypothetical protein
MNHEELEELLHENASALPCEVLDGFTASVMSRLGPRERRQDVCLVMGSATVIAFCLALAVASYTANGTAPPLKIFRPQPESHPFAMP